MRALEPPYYGGLQFRHLLFPHYFRQRRICLWHENPAPQRGGQIYSLEVEISVLHICADQLHAEHVADVHVFKTDAPVTWESNGSPILDFSSMVAADFMTCRSTFFAASSSSVQCLASVVNSSFAS